MRPLVTNWRTISVPGRAHAPAADTVAIVFVGALLALCVVGLALPSSTLAGGPGIGIMLETMDGGVLLLVACVTIGRLPPNDRDDDWLIAGSFFVLGASSLLLWATPLALERGDPAVVAWAPAIARLLGAAGLAYAAWGPRFSAAATVSKRGSAIVSIGLIVAIGILVPLSDPLLPDAAALRVDGSVVERFRDDSIYTSVVLGCFILLVVATIGFSLSGRRSHGTWWAYLAGASALAVFARVSFFLYPTVRSDHLYPADFVRLGAYTLLAIGGTRAVSSRALRIPANLVVEERRRLARDIHDGLAQELAFISSKARSMPRVAPSGADFDAIASAADRALVESRCAIAALSRDGDGSLEERIIETTEMLAYRAGARARFEFQEGVEASPAVCEALVRIVGEAVTNAVRHSGTDVVEVSVCRDDHLHLVVRDAGRGFDPLTVHHGCFGIEGIRERAAEIGGEVRLRSRRGCGTEIEVIVP